AGNARKATGFSRKLGEGVPFSVRIDSVQVALILMFVMSVGCAPIAPLPAPSDPVDHEALDALKAEVARQTDTLSGMQTTLDAVRTEQQAASTEQTLQTHALERVEGSVIALPDSLKRMCPPQPRIEPKCKDPQIQRVMVSGTKMVVGDVEQIWIDPPGIPLNARIDTTATNNTLQAEAIVEFERDGKSWVRFVLHAPDSKTPINLERRVSRHVRAVQSGAGEGIKRPIVRMQIKLGDVQDSFRFILTDRVEADHQVVLGRSFLKDIALVDVGARYVQPRSTKIPAPLTEKRTP
ncbi:MAG: RimK/LysX family protein, partial [Proteobacteria bacterium]|nr:RimK/LysX family protein [Pseudomonadota bacterium]